MKKKITTILFFFTVLLYSNIAFSQSWNALTGGTSGTVNAVTVYNGALIAAGSFVTANGVTVNNIAAWNGASWSTLGTGTNGVVYALYIFNNELIAAGGFTTAGGNACNRIARWNGTTWSALGLGTNDTVYALGIYTNNLRVGGKFTTAGGVACNRIARWDGTSWAAMNIGLSGPVYGLATATDLYITGNFTNGGGFVGNRIARYNGNYFQLGSGIDNGQGNAIILYNNNIYVGGSFTTIGGVTVNNIARWTGTNWNTVGSGITGTVYSFAVNGANLVVGGNFTNAGGTSANSIANWNGTSYSALGAGITGGNATVYGITPWSNILIAGGSFSTAGLVSNVGANNIAAFGSIPVAPTLLTPANASTGVSLTPVLDWTDVTATSTYGVQLSISPSFSSFLINQGGLATSQYTVPNALLTNNTVYFWRATASNGLGTSPFSGVFFFTSSLVGIIHNEEIPLSFNLYQNYPNPFNPVTRIKFDLPSGITGAKLNLNVYDVEGKVVANLLNTDYAAGKWEIDFDASNLPSGAYFYKITAGNFSSVNKMILIK